MRKMLLLLTGLACSTALFSQKKTDKDPPRARRVEIGLNITSSLAGFFNSGGDQVPADPFLVSIKLVGRKNALRLGLNVRADQSDNSETGLDGSRTRYDNKFDARFGWEHRAVVARNFGMHWGLDAIGRFQNEKVDFNSSIGTATLKSFRASAGGGPFLGMTWAPAPRIVFGTEATLYGFVYREEEERQVPLEPINTKKSVGFELASIPPTSLYIHFKF